MATTEPNAETKHPAMDTFMDAMLIFGSLLMFVCIVPAVYFGSGVIGVSVLAFVTAVAFVAGCTRAYYGAK